MGWLSTVHQSSGRTTLWNGYPIMLCGKVVRCEPGSGWRNTSQQVDCSGCRKRMERHA